MTRGICFSGPVTPTPIAERLAVHLSLPVFTTYVCRGLDSNTQPSACEANVLTHCAVAAVPHFLNPCSMNMVTLIYIHLNNLMLLVISIIHIFVLRDLCSFVYHIIIRKVYSVNNAVSLYDIYGHALALEPLSQGS